MVSNLRAGAGLLASALLALFLSMGCAFAHASLVGATPGDNSVVAQSPDCIELDFNEPVQLLGLRLLDASDGDRSPSTAPEAADGRILWKLPEPLGAGRYLVSWRAESLDGHIVSGTFAFRVGSEEQSSPAGMSRESEGANGMPDRWAYFGLHAVSRLFSLFAVGTALFHFLLAKSDPDGWMMRTTRRLSAGGVLALILFIAAEGAMRAGLPISGMFSREALSAAFAAPNLAWRGLGLIGLLLILIAPGRKLQGFGGATAILSMADSGHALTMLPAGMGYGLMLAHGFAAAAWMGAIAPLRHALQRDSGPATQSLFRRFQTYGGLAMGTTLASGLLLTWLVLPHLSDLWQSAYGLRLSAKLAVVGIMVLIAAGNRLLLARRALAGRERVRRLLVAILGFDFVTAAMATFMAVGLSLGAPPQKTLDVVVADQAYDGILSVSPGKAGDNELRIVLAAKAGAPADPEEVEVRLTMEGMEPMVRKATRTGAGRYLIRQLPLWMSGRWNIELHILVDDFTSVELSAPVAVRQ
jgi:copper transport protein